MNMLLQGVPSLRLKSPDRFACSGLTAPDDQSRQLGPLQPQSEVGIRLQQLLLEGDEIFQAAVETELTRLSQELDAEEQQQSEISHITNEYQVLNRRMVEIKSAERQRTLEDIMYTSILSQVTEFGVPLIPSVTGEGLSQLYSTKFTDIQALLDVPFPEAKTVVVEHVRKVSTGLPKVSGDSPILLPKLGVAQVYASSIIFGYCLRRVTERYALEKRVRSKEDENPPAGRFFREKLKSIQTERAKKKGVFVQVPLSSMITAPRIEESLLPLEDYANECLQQLGQNDAKNLSKFSSTKAELVAERHTSALFGDFKELSRCMRETIADSYSPDEVRQRIEEAMRAGEVESLSLPIQAVRRLVLEAVAVGTCLWDVERRVDMHLRIR
ncbi:hypothetical protein CYMTET_12772 [Cymbomonas tetramitiformis]|uniref:Uncharacterized protein n=1 Tax=Cymbomonas tetramitiformis TaxID=36881 RepID=A0AAE0GJM2_9CHLO|nr:hypothetical protein CYMTET_12772 [Cymbomonas tetramitiformis]